MTQVPEFTEALKYEWPLNSDSLVVDVGAYHGIFAMHIMAKFACKVWAFEPIYWREAMANAYGGNITVFPNALGAVHAIMSFGKSNDSSGHWSPGEQVEVSVLPVETLYVHSHVGLLKLNCEGAEYEILERIINDDKLCIFDAIMVQFHIIDGIHAQERREAIIHAIERTHRPVFSSPWCWEAWSLR